MQPLKTDELRSRHPVIDCVGNLEDSRQDCWLVYIQVSLQRHQSHRKLHDIFGQLPKKYAPELKESRTLYNFYRDLSKIDKDTKANVMLAYVSPVETDII